MATIAMLVGEGFEASEVRVPVEQLTAAGHRVTTLGARAGETLSDKHGRAQVTVDAAAAASAPEAFAALVIPGGRGPAHLCADASVVDFVRRFVATGRPVAAICHGPQLLAAAGALRGRRVTSWPKVRAELEAEGAEWRDAEVVVDGGVITSRQPSDLDAFCAVLLAALR